MGLTLEPRVIRKYRKLAEPIEMKKKGIYSFPGTNYSVYTFHDGRQVRVHNILQDQMIRKNGKLIGKMKFVA